MESLPSICTLTSRIGVCIPAGPNTGDVPWVPEHDRDEGNRLPADGSLGGPGGGGRGEQKVEI